jgi:hypothetical protein
MEATMPSPGTPSPENRGIFWLRIVKTLLVQVLVLLALSVAFVGYLRWSSDTNWAEFLSAAGSAPPDAEKSPLSTATVQTGKRQTRCDKKS